MQREVPQSEVSCARRETQCRPMLEMNCSQIQLQIVFKFL